MMHFIKLWRYAATYGLSRALVKALARTRLPVPAIWMWRRTGPGVGVIGCGQFAFSTVAFFLRGCCRIEVCYDVDHGAADSFARFWRVPLVSCTAAAVVNNPKVSCVFITSNHASHAAYAGAALAAGKDVYVEKPVAVEREQLRRLSRQREEGAGRLFAGYNRPFSAAIHDLRAEIGDVNGPLTLACFISGHVLAPDHWYRHPSEGTRVCGNVGHWLDLAIHILGWRSVPDRWRISLQWANESVRDDDLAISLSSKTGDLINIVLTARTEPFEGIREAIHLQWQDVICNIDDFRSMTIWNNQRRRTWRYWPKDVGHRNAIRQPFREQIRPWSEVEDSSLLMLRIAEMVKCGTNEGLFSFIEERTRLHTDVHQ